MEFFVNFGAVVLVAVALVVLILVTGWIMKKIKGPDSGNVLVKLFDYVVFGIIKKGEKVKTNPFNGPQVQVYEHSENNHRKIREYQMSTTKFIIGRYRGKYVSESRFIDIPKQYISRKHLKIFRIIEDGDVFYVAKNMSKKSETYVNDFKYKDSEHRVMEYGEEIELSKVTSFFIGNIEIVIRLKEKMIPQTKVKPNDMKKDSAVNNKETDNESGKAKAFDSAAFKGKL